MKKLAFLFFAVTLFVAGAQIAQAFSVTLSTKQITVQFVITPSPTPVGYVPTNSMIAYSPFSMSDAMSGMVVAQSTPQSSVKVQFVVKPDPNYQYFHIIPGASTTFNAAYGSNTFTCAFKIYAGYATSWTVSDYIYGSNTTGGTAGLNGYPQYNYPTTSLLTWLAETQTTSFKPFSNGGSPGEVTFNGAGGSNKTICIDLGLSVPNSIPAGTYSTTITYYFQHT